MRIELKLQLGYCFWISVFLSLSHTNPESPNRGLVCGFGWFGFDFWLISGCGWPWVAVGENLWPGLWILGCGWELLCFVGENCYGFWGWEGLWVCWFVAAGEFVPWWVCWFVAAGEFVPLVGLLICGRQWVCSFVGLLISGCWWVRSFVGLLICDHQWVCGFDLCWNGEEGKLGKEEEKKNWRRGERKW